jgi:hypothetical protein
MIESIQSVEEFHEELQQMQEGTHQKWKSINLILNLGSLLHLVASLACDI